MANFVETGVKFQVVGFKQLLQDIKTVDTQTQKIEKTFGQLVKTTNILDKTIKGLSKSFTTLGKSLTVPNRKFLDMSKRIAKANDVMRSTMSRVKSVTSDIEDLGEEQTSLVDTTREVTAQTRLTNSALRSMSTTVKGINIRRFGASLGSVGDGAFGLRGGINSLNTGLNKFKNVVGNIGAGVLNLGKTIANFTVVGLVGLTAGLTAAATAGGSLAVSFESAFTGISKTVDGLTILDDEGIIRLTERGEELDAALVSISNNAPITFEELAKIGELGGQLGILRGVDDADVVQTIESFTETIAGLGEATDLTTEAAATQLAQFQNIFTQEIDNTAENIEDLGNTLVGLGNNSATTESQILNFASQMAGAGQVAGLSQADVLGLSAAFSSLGIQAEAGASAVSTIFLDMQKAIQGNTTGFVDNSNVIGDNQEKLLELNATLVKLEAQTGITGEEMIAQKDAFIAAGGSLADYGRQLGDTRRKQLFLTQKAINELTQEINNLQKTQGQPFNTEQFETFRQIVNQAGDDVNFTAEQFTRAFEEDAAGVFDLFVKGLATEGDNASKVLDKLGLDGIRTSRVLLSMAGAGDLLTDSIELANNEFSTGSALADEVSNRYATVESRFKILGNVLRNTTRDMTKDFLPTLAKILDRGAELVPIFGEKIPQVLSALSSKLVPIFGDIFSGFEGLELEQTLILGFDKLTEIINNINIQPILNLINTVRNFRLPKNVLSFFDSLNKEFNELKQIIIPLLPTIKNIGFEIVSLITDVTITNLQTFGDILLNILRIGEGLLSLNLHTITSGFSNIGADLAENTLTTISRLAELIGVDLTGAFDSVLGVIERARSSFESGGFFGLLQEFNVPREFIEFLFKMEDAFKRIAFESIPAFGEAISNLFENEAIVGLGNLIKTFVVEQTIAIGEAIQEILPYIIQFGAFMSQIFVGLVGTAIDSLTAFINGLDGVLDVLIGIFTLDLDKIGEGFARIGTAMLEGILSPIKNFGNLINEEIGKVIDLAIIGIKEQLGISSPSKVFMEIGKNIILGLLDGIKNTFSLDSFMDALFGDFDLNNAKSKITGFLGGLFDGSLLGNQTQTEGLKMPEILTLNEDLRTSLLPTLNILDETFTTLYTQTIPLTTQSITDGLIPAKRQLTETNNSELIPSVTDLIDVENVFASTLSGFVNPVVFQHIVILEIAKDKSKELRREIKKITEGYLKLASAINKASSAGSGIPSGPPVSPAGGGIPQFAEGGDFIVPQNIPKSMRGISGGMLMEVHKGERVIVQPQPFATPSISGAGISNFVTNNSSRNSNVTNNNTKNMTLQVAEAVSSNFMDSFALAETMI
jgi:TP901 family phage tail tape measure protein